MRKGRTFSCPCSFLASSTLPANAANLQTHNLPLTAASTLGLMAHSTSMSEAVRS